MAKRETVMCVLRKHVTDIEKDKKLEAGFLTPSHILWVPREICEEDETFLQIIPYPIIKSGTKFLTYERSKAGSEKRLEAKASIGVGGHISQDSIAYWADDISVRNTIFKSMRRELAEELGPLGDRLSRLPPTFKGFIQDEINPVGRVHLGLVFLIEPSNIIEAQELKTPEDALTKLKLLPIKELLDLDNLEAWSKISLRLL